MRSITLGRYLPGSSFLHRLNPRFKLLLLLIALAVIFVLKTYAGFSLLFLLLALAAAAVRLPLRLLAGMLRPIAYIVLITAIILFLFYQGRRRSASPRPANGGAGRSFRGVPGDHARCWGWCSCPCSSRSPRHPLTWPKAWLIFSGRWGALAFRRRSWP